MKAIYDYNSSYEFLKDAWEYKKILNPRLSIRVWAASLGFESHSYLRKILSGKAYISKKTLPQFIKNLGLSSKEGIFLDTLLDFEKSKTEEERSIYQRKLKELRPSKFLSINQTEVFKYLKDPLHIVLLEVVNLEGFQYDLDWIQEKLYFKWRKKEVVEALNRLLDLGLLREESGSLFRTQKHLSNILDVQSRGVQEYHRNISNLAAKALDQDITQREFNGFVMNLDPKDIPQAKEMLRDFLKDFMLAFENDPRKGKKTYQFNLQLFPMTN